MIHQELMVKQGEQLKQGDQLLAKLRLETLRQAVIYREQMRRKLYWMVKGQ